MALSSGRSFSSSACNSFSTAGNVHTAPLFASARSFCTSASGSKTFVQHCLASSVCSAKTATCCSKVSRRSSAFSSGRAPPCAVVSCMLMLSCKLAMRPSMTKLPPKQRSNSASTFLNRFSVARLSLSLLSTSWASDGDSVLSCTGLLSTMESRACMSKTSFSSLPCKASVCIEAVVNSSLRRSQRSWSCASRLRCAVSVSSEALRSCAWSLSSFNPMLETAFVICSSSSRLSDARRSRA
mmetsp:Transcript_48044/g.112242  ORF Transcript_48044/g.112242 Transcript_48044/m.112242 type:complete len:240 (+) Transcript_48044:1258-1977(+)